MSDNKELSLLEKLNKMQRELVVPKTRENSFGGFKYRSCEDILLKLKPFLIDCVIIFNDEVVLIGERYYIKSTAKLTDGKSEFSNTAFAREEFEKKKYDGSQLTGSASSYARKFALNGLLGLDDTQDVDSQVPDSIPTIPLVFGKDIMDCETIEYWADRFIKNININQPEDMLKQFVADNIGTGRNIYAQLKSAKNPMSDELAKIFTRFK